MKPLSEGAELLASITRLRAADFAFDPCVYVLTLQDEPVYVGQTQSLGERLARHRRGLPPGSTRACRDYDGAKGEWFDGALYVVTDVRWLRLREASLIAALQPRYNKPLRLSAVHRVHLRTLFVYGAPVKGEQ